MNANAIRHNNSVEAKAWELKQASEDAIIAMVFLNPASVRFNSHIITGRSFTTPGYGEVYDLAVHLYESNTAVNFPQFVLECKKRSFYDVIGGAVAVAKLTTSQINISNAEYHACELQRLNSLFAIQDACCHATLLAQDLNADPKTVLEHFQNRTSGLGNQASAGFKKFADVLDGMVERYENPEKHPNRRAFKAGFPTLDRMLGGFETGGLYLVGGRSGYGKSALACNFALNMGWAGAKIWFVSLEMKNEQLSSRMISNAETIEYGQFKHGFRKGEIQRLKSGIDSIRAMDMVLTDQANETFKSIAAKARLKKSLSGLDVLIVDNLNLIRWSSRLTKREAFKEHTEGFKILAKDLDIAIILLGQLGAEDREKKTARPHNESWAENRKLSDDADGAIMLHKDGPEAKTAELIITKQRDGQLGEIELDWFGEYQRFTEKI
ncbi:MAG: AAA family ATPase [Pirellula sp.]|jgi:replicative DNA helicase|nr:AAA family ATPase [Pirellula sp.]